VGVFHLGGTRNGLGSNQLPPKCLTGGGRIVEFTGRTGRENVRGGKVGEPASAPQKPGERHGGGSLTEVSVVGG